MMEQGVIYPTLNLENIDPDCAGIRHVQTPLKQTIDIVVLSSVM